MAAIPSDWPIDTSQPVDLSLLRDRQFVLPDPGIAPEIHAACIACRDQAGFQPRVVNYIKDHEEARFLIAAGVGAGFSFATAILGKPDGIRYLPIAPAPKAFVDFHVVWVQRRTPSEARAFIECLESEACSAKVVQAGEAFKIEWVSIAHDRGEASFA